MADASRYFSAPLTALLDGEDVTIIVEKETVSARSRKKQYRQFTMHFRLSAGGPIHRPKPTMQRSWQNILTPEQCTQGEDIVRQWIRARLQWRWRTAARRRRPAASRH